MYPLKFVYKRIGSLYNSEIDEVEKVANELKVTTILAPFLKDLNEEGGYILVKVMRDGSTFKNELKGIKDLSKYPELVNAT